METAKRTVILLSLVLLITSTIQSAEKPEPMKISNTRFASCVVKLTANPRVFPLNYGAIESLLRSSRIAGRAGRDVLGVLPEQSIDLFRIEPLSLDSDGIMPPEPVLGPMPMGDDPMMVEQMRINKQQNMPGMGMYDEMTIEPNSPARERGRSESRYRGRTRADDRSIDLYREEARRPRVEALAPPSPDVEQTLFFRLTVELPDDAKPAAEEFMEVLIDLVRRVMLNNARDYSVRLKDRLNMAAEQVERARSRLTEALGLAPSDADYAAKKQLDTIVDLSMLSLKMPFGDAIEVLKNSVQPPLKIVVLWRELLDNVQVEPSTPINMDGIPQIRLGTALDNLLRAVTDPEDAGLSYKIDHGVITIATRENLQTPQEKLLHSAELGMPAEVLIDQKNQLIRLRQSLDMGSARLNARRSAIEEQIARVNEETAIKVNRDLVIGELQRLLETQIKQLENIKKLIDAGRAQTDALIDAEEKVAKTRIELAKRREELGQSAGGDQLARFNNELADIMIDLAEKRAEFGVIDGQLAQTEKQLMMVADSESEISRIRIVKQILETAERRVIELEMLLVGLQEPTVTVLGAD